MILEKSVNNDFTKACSRAINALNRESFNNFDYIKRYTDKDIKERVKMLASIFIADLRSKTSQYVSFIIDKSKQKIVFRISDHSVGYDTHLDERDKNEGKLSDLWLSLYFCKGGKDCAVKFNGNGKALDSGDVDYEKGIKHRNGKTIKIQYALNSDHLFSPEDMRTLRDALVNLFQTGEFKCPFPVKESLSNQFLSLHDYIEMYTWPAII